MLGVNEGFAVRFAVCGTVGSSLGIKVGVILGLEVGELIGINEG